VATLCTEEFGILARDEATGLGYPGLPIVMIPHPLGDRPEAWVREAARSALAEIVGALTSPAEALVKQYRGRYPEARGDMRYRTKFK